MENKKVNVVFCLVLIFFLGLTYLLLKSYNDRRMGELNDLISLSKVIKQRNTQVIMLAKLLRMKERENAELRLKMQETVNDLDILRQKLAQPAPSAPPAAPAAPAAPTPAVPAANPAK